MIASVASLMDSQDSECRFNTILIISMLSDVPAGREAILKDGNFAAKITQTDVFHRSNVIPLVAVLFANLTAIPKGQQFVIDRPQIVLSLVELLGSINPTTVRHCLIAINNISKLASSATLLTDCIQRASDPPSNLAALSQEIKVEFLRKMHGISSLELGQRLMGTRSEIVQLLVDELSSKEAPILYLCSGILGQFFFSLFFFLFSFFFFLRDLLPLSSESDLNRGMCSIAD